MKILQFFSLLLFLGLLRPSQALAIILMGTGDPQANTTPPTGELANSGWQWVGKWGKTSGIAIAPKYFITVKHVGGNILDPFILNGQSYSAVRFYDDPETDIRIVLVVGTLPQYASLQSSPDELGKRAVAIGRGTQRGDPLFISERASLVLKGWKWGLPDAVMRWGENRVSGILRNLEGGVETLFMRFDQSGGPNEAHVSPGDSGGGLFLQDGLSWKLAGLINTTEGFYSLGPTGPAVSAAVFDQGGLYVGGNPSWQLIPDTSFDQPARFFCIRVFARLEWIRGVIGTTRSDLPAQLLVSSNPKGPFIERTDARVDAANHTVSIPASAAQEFYRIKSSRLVTINGVQVQDGTVTLTYD